MTGEPRTACAPITAATVVGLLSEGRFNLATEAATQNDIGALLAAELGPERFTREHKLGPGERVDFMVDGRIALEVKRFRRTNVREVLRQLERYAAHAEVEALVLATGHAMGLPAAIGGKPLHVVNVGRGWL